MSMTPSVRRLALTAHVASSVGWLGAAACFLALAVAGLTSRDAQIVRGLYLAMAVTGWYVIVPLCLASLATGLIQSLGTPWGLFRHYWVSAKFLLTAVSAVVLFVFTRTLNDMGVAATGAAMPIDELRRLSQSPVLHSGGGLLILLVNTTLSVYKPWGRTPYGLRKRHEQNEDPPAAQVSYPGGRRGRFILFGVVGLLLLFLILHLGLRGGH